LGLLDIIPDPEKQTEQAEQAEQNNSFIRFKDINNKDIDTDNNIEIELY
jgi:hypothetical protein